MNAKYPGTEGAGFACSGAGFAGAGFTGSGFAGSGFVGSGSGGFSVGITSIHVMISQPLHISFVLIFSGEQHTTLIITVLSFSLKVWSRI